jgi:hypothetical protein
MTHRWLTSFVGRLSLLLSLGYFFFPTVMMVIISFLLNIVLFMIFFLNNELSFIFYHGFYFLTLIFFPIILLVIHRSFLHGSWISHRYFQEIKWVEAFEEKTVTILMRLGIILLFFMTFFHGINQIFFADDLLMNLYHRLRLSSLLGSVEFALFLLGTCELLMALGLFFLKNQSLLTLLRMMVVWNVIMECLFLLSGWEGASVYFLTRIPVMCLPLIIYYLVKIRERETGLIPVRNFSIEKTGTWSFSKN